MTTPISPVPDSISRWTSRIRWLRRADAALGWLVLFGVVLRVLPAPAAAAVGAALLVAGALLVPALRVRWRPVSASVALSLSRGLNPGDRAWYVRGSAVDPVIVTARQGARVVIARPDLAASEGLSVRRTRVLLLPDEGATR